jgi:hypothetical protein
MSLLDTIWLSQPSHQIQAAVLWQAATEQVETLRGPDPTPAIICLNGWSVILYPDGTYSANRDA